jgi:predicted nucleotidyltransferase
MATAKSEELRALAQRVADALPPEVVEVVLTGSVSRGVADDVSDIEMLVVTEKHVSLEEAFELARRAGLEERDSWGDPATPTRRVSGYLDGQAVETIWWSRDHAEEHFDSGASAEAIANGIPLRTSGLLAGWQERLREFPEDLAVQHIEAAAERWGGFTPAGLLTIIRPGDRLQLLEWLVDAATRTLTIVYALNRTWQPTTKRLAARLEPLAVKPDRIAARIEEALTEPDPRRALATMTELQLDTVRLAPNGPNVDRAEAWLAEGLALLRE